MAERETLSQEPGTLPWLVEIMQRLLAPDGCPWDREQTLQTLRPYLVEECYEVLDAIDDGDREHHCEELGDLLLQIVFQTELASIEMQAVVTSIGEKLIRRHPHVFGDVAVRNSGDVVDNWEAIKAVEKQRRKARRAQPGPQSALDGIPRGLPALHRAHVLTRKASKLGVELSEPHQSLANCLDALATQETDQPGAGADGLVGDALLRLASWARQLGVEPEQALRDALARFEDEVRAHEAKRAS